MIRAEKVRLVNPSTKRRAAKGSAGRRKKSRTRKNPAELFSLGILNPHKKERNKNMKRKAKRTASKRKTTRRKSVRRSNPAMFGGRRHKRTTRRRNPHQCVSCTASGLSAAGTSSILKGGFYALLGLVVARQAPQMVLGTRNTGLIGYIANIAATVIASMIGSRFLGGDAGKYMLVGGGVYVVNRALQDNLSPVGKVLSLSGMGDYNSLGDIRSGYFPLPVPTMANGMPIIPNEIRAVAPAPAGSKGVGSVSMNTRFRSRF